MNLKLRAFDEGEMIYPKSTSFKDLAAFFSSLSEDAIIMQSTGMKDKEGVEIFENDILEDVEKWAFYSREWFWILERAKMEGEEQFKEARLRYEQLPQPTRLVSIHIDEGINFREEDANNYYRVIGNSYENPNIEIVVT